MLTPERIETLTAVEQGTVQAHSTNAPGSPLRFEPREHTVRVGFLQKAGLITVDTVYVLVKNTKVPRSTVTVTKKGNRALAYATA